MFYNYAELEGGTQVAFSNALRELSSSIGAVGLVATSRCVTPTAL